jgi:hypothetical protein
MLLLIPGIALPTLSGWLAVRLLEGKAPVLFAPERWIYGFVFGITGTMYITFLLHILGLIDFTFWGFALTQILITFVLGLLYRIYTPAPATVAIDWKGTQCALWMKILIVLLIGWTLLKLFTGAFLLTQSPPYHDDVFNNWNMRGKLFYETQRLTLTIPIGDELTSRFGVSSYPQTVPMIKTWLSTLAGSWNESLVNSIHILWYISALALVFFALLHTTTLVWALLGTYILSSLPFYMINGMNAYADVFLSAHVFAAVSLLFFAIKTEKMSYFALFSLALALLVFTKNEALMLYVPPLLLIAGIAYIKKILSMRHMLFALGALALTLIPWLTFKWMNGLPFGNAKSIAGMSFGLRADVPYAIGINTFLEGNWLLLFPLVIIVFFWKWRHACKTSFMVMTGFFLIVYFGQISLYLFTSLAEEALKQTGYARGLIHVMPVLCTLLTTLLYNARSKKM